MTSKYDEKGNEFHFSGCECCECAKRDLIQSEFIVNCSCVYIYMCIMGLKTILENVAKFSLDNRIELKDPLSFNRLQFLKI